MIYSDPWLTDSDHCSIEAATSFPSLVEIAISVIARNRIHSLPVVQVCGPMASGGGKLDENAAKIARTIAALRKKGLTVFSQVPFQRGMLNFTTVEDYMRNPHELLDGFYGRLFRGRHIQALTFIKGWENSFGCRWEHDTGKALDMHISFLPD
jgi:hypothetical protein